jgi:hypothetical protein
VSLIGYEESESEQLASRKLRSSRRPRNPLQVAEAAEDEVDQSMPADEAQPASPNARAVDNDEGDDPPAAQNQRPTGRKSKRATVQLDSDNEGRRHPLED